MTMMVWPEANGGCVGGCGLHRLSRTRRVFQIGGWCRKRYQGEGSITEAARAVVAFAFEKPGARHVWCGSDDLNTKSWRLAERAGFVYEGTLRSERADPDGTRRDMRAYAITR